MKKLLAACTLLVSSYAFADIPANFEQVDAGENNAVFVNKTSGALFGASVVASEGAAANAILTAAAPQFNCASEVKGDAEFASVEGCKVNDQNVEVAVAVGGDKAVVFYVNDKITHDEVNAFIAEMLK